MSEHLQSPFVIMTVGIPGSGKSTLAKRLAEEFSATRICPDDIREELTGDATDQSTTTEVWQITHQRAEESIESGTSVVVDATYAKEEDRRRDVTKYRSYGAKAIIAMMLDVPLDVAKQRNSARRERIVPEYVLDRTYNSLLAHPPSLEEGFDEIIKIKD